MEEYDDGIKVVVADASHEKYVDTILKTITDAAKVRGSGIASRTHEYVATKMKERKAIIALYGEEFAGFCYIESWENKHYVANSGLIVVPKFRGHHLATRIKRLAFSLSRVRWPQAKIFGLTSSGPVMRINTSLGYVPVPFSELTQDDEYWKDAAPLKLLVASIATCSLVRIVSIAYAQACSSTLPVTPTLRCLWRFRKMYLISSRHTSKPREQHLSRNKLQAINGAFCHV